jgi:hypothetical protein
VLHRYGVFKVRVDSERPQEKTASKDGLSKLNSVPHVEVDVFLGELDHWTSKNKLIDRPSASGVRAPASLERR